MNRKKKEPKRKPKYGMLSCVAYMYRLMWKYEKSLVFTAIGRVPVELAASALALYTPSVILGMLETSDAFSAVALVVTGLVLAGMLSSLAGSLIGAKGEFSEMYLVHRMLFDFFRMGALRAGNGYWS